MSRRILPSLVLAAILTCAGYGGFRWYQGKAPASGEATAVLQVPRELMTQVHLFERTSEAGNPGYRLSNEIVDGTLSRLKDRQILLQPTQPNESPRECLLSHCRVQVEPEAGQDRVTLSYFCPSAAEALPILTAVVDTLREAQLPREAATGRFSDGRPSQLTILLERESSVAERIRELEAELEQQSAAVDEYGLSEVDRVVLPEQIKRLGVDLAEARRDRLEAEHRLIQIRKDLAAGLPVNLLVSRLPGQDAREALQKVLARPQFDEELRTERTAYERLAKTYGRKHPKMVELRQKIDALQSRAAAVDADVSGNAESAQPVELLQRLLLADFEERQALESDLQEQFDARKGALDQQANWAAAAVRLQKERQSLLEERESVRRKIAESRRLRQEHIAEVLVPPGIAETSWDSRLPFRALVGFVGGLAFVTVLYLQKSRKNADRSDLQSERTDEVVVARKEKGLNPVGRSMPLHSDVPSPLATLLSARKPLAVTSHDPQRDKADRAARLARLKSLTQSPTLAPHSV